MEPLSDKIQLDENIKSLISKMEKELEFKGKEIESKDKEISGLKNELEYLRSLILNKNKKIFGQSSEKLDYVQLSIFNEAEVYSDLNKEELVEEEITYTRNKPSKNKGKKDNFANLDRVTIHHTLEDAEKLCGTCSTEMECIGTTTKEILKHIPAKVYVEEHITYSYSCKPCKEEQEKSNIITTKSPATLLHKSMASNELLSHVISLKYMYALPLHRQENYFNMLGISLSRQTLSNWIIGAANEFKPVYEIMKEELIKRNYVQADETTVKVLDNKGDESRSKHYMWLYRSGTSIAPIILYDYQRTRASSCPTNFLKGFSGILQTDGYNGYNKVENTERLYCLAHIRRKFHEIVVTLKNEALEGSLAYKGFNYCENLYKVEKELRETYSQEEDYFKIRYDVRLEKSSPILDEFIEFVNKNTLNSLAKSALGLALEYAKNHLPSFKIFLKNGALEIDNNASERCMKAFVVGRKNWLFSKSKNGAESSGIIYSIIETAKANNLMVEKYLIYLMDAISNKDNNDMCKLIDFMPWSQKLPNDLRISPKSNR